MPETPNKFYLTTPIYYVNARPHIGHAYSTIAADVIARRHRLLGDDTFFLTGTDEHGQKVQRSAEKAGIPPQQFADEVSATFRDLWKRMGILDDSLSKDDPLLHRDYIRTTDARHKRGVQKLWRTLEERGAIYLSTYTGQYSVGEEMFIDGPPGTLGPDGKPTETVTEENYFFRLSDYQQPLIDLIESNQLHIQPDAIRNEVLSFLRGNVAEVVTDVHDRVWAGTEKLAPHPDPGPVKIAENEGRIKKSASGHYYVPGALKDLSISRTTFDWGIPVPGNPKHVIYVWLDALANYITSIGYGSDDPADIAKFAKYWPADLHLVGKEITRFHCVYWPAFLMAAGLKLPKSVVANGWLLFEESKMSKSRGNVVRTETILDAFGEHVYAKQFPNSTKQQQDLFASDVIRYFLLREIPFGQDGSFSFDALITRYNADLANGYGNLVSRTLNLIHQTSSGVVPTHAPFEKFLQNIADRPRARHSLPSPNDLISIEVEGPRLAGEAKAALMFYEEAFKKFRFASPLDQSLSKGWQAGVLDCLEFLITQTDGFMTAKAPWKLAKSQNPKDVEHLNDVLYTAAESIRIITALLYPVMPYATASVWAQLGLGSIEEAARNGELKNLQWGGLKPGTKLGSLAPIFPRADKGLAQIMIDMENPAAADSGTSTPTVPTTPAPTATTAHAATVTTASAPTGAGESVSSVASVVSPSSPVTATAEIAIDDFVKVDLRVGQIVVAERIPKTDKLLRLEVDLGPGFTPSRWQILSGIAEWYTPEELIGRRIAVIVNLAPRKMRGLESHGMLLAASADDHASKPILATFSDEVPLGSRIR